MANYYKSYNRLKDCLNDYEKIRKKGSFQEPLVLAKDVNTKGAKMFILTEYKYFKKYYLSMNYSKEKNFYEVNIQKNLQKKTSYF